MGHNLYLSFYYGKKKNGGTDFYSTLDLNVWYGIGNSPYLGGKNAYNICRFLPYPFDSTTHELTPFYEKITAGNAMEKIRLHLAKKYNVSPDYLSRAWERWTK